MRSPIPFNATLKLQAGAAHDWVRLLLTVHRQLECPDSLLRHPVVWDPLVESLIHGLLLVADHPYRQKLAAPADPGRPAAVRDAMDIIDAGPHLRTGRPRVKLVEGAVLLAVTRQAVTEQHGSVPDNIDAISSVTEERIRRG